jgi:hypothetical protein
MSISRPESLRLSALLLTLTFPLCASSEVAIVTSTAPFQLRGVSVATNEGVPSWPVMSGDIIQAGNAPVMLVFGDRSSIILDPETSARVELSGQTPVFRLVCGGAYYSLKGFTALKLMAQNDPFIASQLTGAYSVCNGRPASGWRTPDPTTLILAKAGLTAGLGMGITAATSGGASVGLR